jgi:hypothetical protein
MYLSVQIPIEVWEYHKEEILRLYVTERKRLEDIREHFRRYHWFEAT